MTSRTNIRPCFLSLLLVLLQCSSSKQFNIKNESNDPSSSHKCYEQQIDLFKVNGLVSAIRVLADTTHPICFDSCTSLQFKNIKPGVELFKMLPQYMGHMDITKENGTLVTATTLLNCEQTANSPCVHIALTKCFNGQCHDGVLYFLKLDKTKDGYNIIDKTFGGY